MVASLISRLVVLTLGTLYPAYQSYKAVKKRDPKGYVKWMMYWIVFALFTCIETFADIFASIIPLYYELKIVFILWLISPWTKGSTYLYRKFVHPTLSKRESEIDEYLTHASTKGYEALKKVGTNGLTIAANVMVNSAMKGQTTLLDHLKNYATLQKSANPALTMGETIPEEGPDGDHRYNDDRYDDDEYIPSSEEDTDDYQQPSADIRDSYPDVRGPDIRGRDVRGPDIWGPDPRGSEMNRGMEYRGYEVRPARGMVQSMYEMDNRYVEEQFYDPMGESSYQPSQSPARVHRRRLISAADKQYQDSEGSEEGFEGTKHHSLRRTTSDNFEPGSMVRHPSMEKLAYSKYASTENIDTDTRLRRSKRQQEMFKRATRHRKHDPRPPTTPNPKV